jgi:hypothetical protein
MSTLINTIKRSKIYCDIYPDDLMLAAFGTISPSITERNEYFFNKWMSWRDQRLLLPPGMSKQHVNTVCKNLGYRDFWDYQIRGRTVRFSDPDMLAFFRLSASEFKWS